MSRRPRDRQHYNRRALQNAPQLRPFILSHVTPTNKRLGEGSYGHVEELEVNGLICAGKRIYESLIDSGNEGAHRIIQKYYDECNLLSSLRHPNIVQFLGICFLDAQPNSPLNLPVLVMERLEESLDNLLENTPNIPLAHKCSILQDVATGLLYLHNHRPAIIHRDLTARNVLLNSAMKAKIADMGNSRIVNIEPGQLARTMTKGVPGTVVYMPPEAFEVPPKYGPMLDMFSFGHLALFTAIQEFPGVLLPPNYQDPKTGRLVPRNEVKRRSNYINILQREFDNSHELVQLIRQCLEYSSARRPSASEALQRLQHISSKVADHYHHMTRLQLEEQLREKDKLLTEKNEQNMQLQETLQQVEALEARERELLQELKKMKGVEGKRPVQATGELYASYRGMKYDMKLGCSRGNTYETLILVSVGSTFPANVQVQCRVKNPDLAENAIQTYGPLPPVVTGLHKEAAADLMARASLELQTSNADLVRLSLDVSGKQRSREYYKNTIKEFLKLCQQPVAVLRYLGHSEKGTGNWCFKDGTISFQEIFELYREYSPGKVLSIVSDCCYSGNWVRHCAETLDRLGIPPCGHHARERGIQIKVFASCQPNQIAAEPCYSVEAVTVRNDGTQTTSAKQLTQQRSAWFDSTRLVCCKAPDSPCPRNTFQHLKWKDGVDRKFNIQTITRREGGVDRWYYIMPHRAGDEYAADFKAQFDRDSALQLTDWGYVLESGQGEAIPQSIQEKVDNWTDVAW